MTILTIVSGSLVAVKHGVVTANIDSMADVLRVQAADYSLSVSSSVDFPEEYTSNPKVIALCREIRS